MLPWQRRAPLSLAAGITAAGGWGREEDVSPAAPRAGALRLVTAPLPSHPVSSRPTLEASSQQEGC